MAKFIDVALTGQPVRREEWGVSQGVGWTADAILIWRVNGDPYSPTFDDLCADDWEIHPTARDNSVLVSRETLEDAWNKAIKDESITCDDLARELGL